MRILCKGLFVFIFCLSKVGYSQNYIHYTTENGLPSDELYSGLQDDKGFILINSKDGLIRFDGSRFKLYTVKDGLTDNEIIKSIKDANGNIWLTPFHNSICYYKNGEVFNGKTNKLLSQLNKKRAPSNIWEFGTSIYGNVLLSQRSEKLVNSFYCISNDSIQTFTIRSKVKCPIETTDGIYWLDQNLTHWRANSGDIKKTKVGTEFIGDVHNFFHYKGFHYCTDKDLRLSGEKQKLHKLLLRNGTPTIVESRDLENKGVVPDNITFLENQLFVTQQNAIYTCDLSLNNWKRFHQFDREIIINGTFFDRQKNLWVVTYKNGLYLFPNTSIPPTLSTLNNLDTISLFTTLQSENEIAYLKDGYLIWGNLKIPINNFHGIRSNIKSDKGRVYFLNRNQDMVILKQDESWTIRKSNLEKTLIKDFSVENGVVAKALFNGLQITDQNRKEHFIFGRTTCAEITNAGRRVYAGSLGGLTCFEKNNGGWEVKPMNKSLNKRVVKLLEDPQGILWIMEQDRILALYKDQVIGTLSDSSGLVSSTLNNISLGNHKLIVSTNAGVSVIDYSLQGNQIIFEKIDYITKENGLQDVYIKQAGVFKNNLIVRTNNITQTIDLTSPKEKLYKPAIINFKANGRSVPLDSLYLSYKQQSISIDFASLTYGYQANKYYYRIKELTDTWQETSDYSCYFQELNPGNYTFEIRAQFKNGQETSPIANLNFFIRPAFWQTWSFKIATLLFGLFLVYYVANLWYQKRRIKLQSERDFAQLKLQALKAQMNPHFIFNSLNSIQNFINHGDIDKSNMYIAQFSELIRQSLNYATLDYISLKDEIIFLDNYMQLEQLRSNNKFEYSISVLNGIDRSNTFLPPMMLQIYVENAIRHGVSTLKGRGRIELDFSLLGKYLICSIDDNGVGRFANDNKIGGKFVSKGTLLNKERIGAYKLVLEDDISINWIDKKDEEGNAKGTRVEIKIPL